MPHVIREHLVGESGLRWLERSARRIAAPERDRVDGATRAVVGVRVRHHRPRPVLCLGEKRGVGWDERRIRFHDHAVSARRALEIAHVRGPDRIARANHSAGQRRHH